MANLGFKAFSGTWMRSPEMSGGLVLAILGLFLPTTLTILYAFYNAYLHPLRHYPGPLLWRSFRIPYVISVHRGELHNRLKEFHTKYGRIVRIAPNELSYTDSAAWKDIYSTRPGQLVFPRNPTWFRKMTPDEPNSILGPHEEDHARFRRAFSHSFSDKSLRDQAPVVESYVDTFIDQLSAPVSGRKWTEKTVNLEHWLNYLTFDISGDLSFGESFDCLSNGKLHPWVETVHDFGKALTLIASINQYPPAEKLLRFVIPKKIMQKSKDHRDMSNAKARKRLALDTDRPDFVTPTKKYADEKSAMTDREWEINMLIIAFASSETVVSSMTAIVRELVQHRGVLHRLAQEIRETFEHEKDIKIATTGDIPYLNAVIDEGLRLDSPVVIGVPRVCPQGGSMVCDRWVPGGTYVAFNQYAANRQAYNFHNPNSFIPERFLNPDPKRDNMACFQPFQVGRNNCVGMKLAYAEMRVILARLLWKFDIRLENEADRWDWGVQKTYILWEKKPLKVVLRQAKTKA
ncbi:benzoate 4-monooxygenase cytochrome P450 [Phaeosphaeriaceae sp. PMI808]|nr:benzoate 4-monooxygenase cytochrome P450 [Phaeosphaeriaceae sp. PMI808]